MNSAWTKKKLSGFLSNFEQQNPHFINSLKLTKRNMRTEGETIEYMTMTVAEITNSPTEDDLTGKLVQITGIPAGSYLNH